MVGAIPIPSSEVVERTEKLLERDRDIYIYGNSDAETAAVATQLREAGFTNVSELRGGVAAWQAFGYPVESGWV
ncbi:MAG: rhodanese-like domain-containing protein [Kamptonema sp. SIO4C4]|nr:rhodanese-like domain-containing protein [Kamptonema sp. SIO4C4]